MNYIIKIFFITLFFTFSCRGKSDKKLIYNISKIDSVQFQITNDVIFFEIDSLTRPFTNCLEFIERSNGDEQLWFLNGPTNEIKIYSFNNRKFVRSIAFLKEGPEGVGLVRGFHYFSDDSIALVTTLRRFYISNSKGDVFFKKNYYEAPGYEVGTALMETSYYNPPFLLNNKIHLSLGIYHWTEMSAEMISQRPIDMIFGSNTTSLKLNFPKTYLSDGLHPFIYSRVRHKNSVIYSFATDNNLYVTSDFGSFDVIPSKSVYFPESFKSMTNCCKTGFDYKLFLIENSKYRSIVYDKYRGIYYRFCDIGYEMMERSNDEFGNMSHYMTTHPSQSIIILDENLRVIGETKLPERMYKLDNFFITREGLYVSNYNLDNPLFSEDQMSFTLLKLAENKK